MRSGYVNYALVCYRYYLYYYYVLCCTALSNKGCTFETCRYRYDPGYAIVLPNTRLQLTGMSPSRDSRVSRQKAGAETIGLKDLCN